MKYLLLALFISFTCVNADDTQRIESIVKDIKKLRTNYVDTVNELSIYKLKLEKQENINIELTKTIKLLNQKLSNNKKVLTKKKSSKASSFRLNKNATIYDRINGEKISQWERGISFTSNLQKNRWIKITGYFVDKAWKKSKKSMWIKALNTTLRR